MEFTGERFIPGSDDLLSAEHLQRYLFASRFARCRSVLDIACGSGYGSHMLREAGATKVTGVDLSSEAVTYATKLYGHERITFLAANAEQFCSGAYDLVVSFETLEHLDQRQQFLANLRSMTAPGGTLVISTPNKAITSPLRSPDRIRNTYHKYEYVEGEFIAALQTAGFKDIKKYGQHSYPSIFRVQWISRMLRRWWNRDSRETAVVLPMIGSGIPRYFVFVAHR